METFYVVTNTLGTICEEHKTTFFREVVVYQKGDKQHKGILHAKCRNRILWFTLLYVDDGVLYKFLLFIVRAVSFRFLEPNTYVINGYIAAILGIGFYCGGN